VAEPDLYDIAYLAGGRERVVDTAVVVLVRSGRVRVLAPGQLATVDPTRRHPVEAAVLDAMGTTGYRSIDTMRWRLTGDQRLDALGHALRTAGLVGRAAGVGTFLRGPHRALGPTRAGRQALAAATTRQDLDPEVLRVALGGPTAMADPRLRAEIFEPPPPPGVGGREIRRNLPLQVDRDPSRAGYRAGDAAIGGGFMAGPPTGF